MEEVDFGHLSVEVRAYILTPDGKAAAEFTVPLGWYAGVCPNVGDVLYHRDRFFSVQRRYFFDPAGVDIPRGWLLVVRELENAPPHTALLEEWIEETRFWREVHEREEEEAIERLRARLKANETNTRKRAKNPAGSTRGKRGK